ncbi:MAG: YceI family protein [Pseudomonadales bacterium]|nr:YceI family protein [Pseudomonadales bacterium]
MVQRRLAVSLIAVVGALSLGGCRVTAPGAPVDSRSTAAKQDAAALGPGRIYRVVADESLLQILAFRGGTLARVGHNHVIASRNLSGDIAVPSDRSQARFELTIPVALLTIDEVSLRAAAGAEFVSEVSDSARDGTRRNMLGEAVLDAVRYPGIALRLVSLGAAAQTATGRGEQYAATIEVALKGQRHAVRVPLRVSVEPDSLVAEGEFTLKQSELGLAPFSVMFGALTVQDELRIKFSLTAR